MSTLTDEEKARIKELLSDMDENGEDITVEKGDQESSKSTKKIQEEFTNRAFVFADGDKNQINELEDKLSIFEETKEKRENPENSDQSYEQIDWKEINNLTIQEIDKALEKIRFKENSEKISQINLPQTSGKTEEVKEEEKTNEST